MRIIHIFHCDKYKGKITTEKKKYQEIKSSDLLRVESFEETW